jgi:hypothetical protein
VTTVPVFTVRVDGSNAKFFIVIVVPPRGVAVGEAGADGVWEEEQPADIQVRIKRTIQAVPNIKREYAGIIP